jgi:hypothetical protein
MRQSRCSGFCYVNIAIRSFGLWWGLLRLTGNWFLRFSFGRSDDRLKELDFYCIFGSIICHSFIFSFYDICIANNTYKKGLFECSFWRQIWLPSYAACARLILGILYVDVNYFSPLVCLLCVCLHPFIVVFVFEMLSVWFCFLHYLQNLHLSFPRTWGRWLKVLLLNCPSFCLRSSFLLSAF